MSTGHRFRFLPVLALVALLAVALAFAACGDDDDDDDDAEETPPADIGTVDVLGIWGDDELAKFEDMVQPWIDSTGGDMAFTGTREITAQLTTRVEGGNPPDVAIPAEVGLFQDFARNGDLVPLSDCPGLEEKVMSEYPQGFIDLGTVDGTLYGFFMKADTKATVWYNPGFFSDNSLTPLTADSSFDDLVSLSDDIFATGTPPWSMGQFANGGTGFPGSDFIQQIILNEAGADVYDGLIDGSVPFTDDAVKDAFEKFGQIALTDGYVAQGGADAINATNFQDSTYLPYEDPPQAGMVYMGGFASGFIGDQFPEAVAGENYDFFTFPGGAVTGGANIVYAFNASDTTCSFLNHLVSAEAQQIWVEAGGFTSVNQNVDTSAYPDVVSQAQAEQLTGAEVFRFDLDDAIGGDLQSTFFVGITEYLANPGDLDSILAYIEAAR
jgi:alpha-glucoside transport system substrate-binding protein